jgi:hypothetical protein
VLCIDCECVTNDLSDECLVCGSRSLFSLAKLVGGTELSQRAHYSLEGTDKDGVEHLLEMAAESLKK